MKISIPELSLVILIGPSGCGKSTFARKQFLPTEVVSSDVCRALVADDENDQTATGDAFDLLHEIVRKRLSRGKLAVVDATNVQPESRKSLVELAHEYHVLPVAIVFDLSERVCQDRNTLRSDRQFGPHVVRNQIQQLRRSLRGLEREGFRYVHKLSSPDEIEAVTIERQPLWNNKREEHGPFDIIGDVHGCLDELLELMAKLGYQVERSEKEFKVTPPDGRKLAFVGDLVDRGPATPDVLRLVMTTVRAGQALCVPGNHDIKLVKALRGKNVQIAHGLAASLEQLAGESAEFRTDATKFLDGLVSHYVLDDGKLVLAHAGMKEAMQGRGSGKVRDFALYGETTGETDEFGLPVRYNWAADYRGKAQVVYGHTPVPEAVWLNNTVNIDTGCVYGGRLTALRYPEREMVDVPSKATYYEARKPFLPTEELAPRALQQTADDVLDIEDVTGKRIVDTRLIPRITIREENAIAALEVMSRYAVDPKWLIYLPPTMSPSETSKLPDLLEHPQEAFAYYRHEGVPHVICEQKHMGSRAVVIVCRDESVSVKRFGVIEPALGVVYTLVAQVIEVLRTDEKGVSYGDVDEVARFAHTVSQQSGSDLKPVAVDSGLFEGNSGAIGGTVTDMTGAVIPNATVRVDAVTGDATASATTKDDGSYIVSDLAPGSYKVRADARGFESFSLTDVHVSSSALTEVDVKLQVGAATSTVTVSADAIATQTMSMSVSTIGKVQGTVKGPNGSATITEQTMTPRLRHVFAETAYWAPSLETNNAGHTAFNFTLPDSLTTWKLHAVGSTLDGRLTEVDRTFKTFQPFFVDLDAPQVLTVGDEITLPVNLRNYTDHAITLPVTVKPADWFTLSTSTNMHATVPPNGSTPVLVGLHAASSVDAGPLRVTAANAHDGDAVEKTVKVHPDGEPRSVTTSALLHGENGNTIRFDLPTDAIAGSVHAELLLYPNLGANVAHAMKAVLERPYGCAEQTISSTYASLLYLELATAAKAESPEKEKAQSFLQLGYERLLGYFNTGGGLTYWGGNDTTGDAALTAYGVEFLTEAEPFVSVDRSRIAGAIQWLLSQQSADGSWMPRYGAVSARETLYIANALQTAIEAKDFSTFTPAGLQARVKQAVAKANAYAATSVLALHDPYSNALRVLLAVRTGDSATLTRAHEELTAGVERGKSGAHWEFDGYSPFYGWGTGGKLETTSLALAALQAAGNKADHALEDDALLPSSAN